jgi:hypothetical protein
MKIRDDIELYKEYDPKGEKSVEELSLHFGWSRQTSYAYKYFISEIDLDKLEILEKSNTEIDLKIIGAICIQNRRFHDHLFANIERINNASSPFTEIEILISEITGEDPLRNLRNQYWIEVGEYLTSRRIDQYPFTKKAIGFIKSIGYNGYKSLTKNQKKWIHGLIHEDKVRPEEDRFFINEHLIYAGYNDECSIIKNYDRCS